MTPLRTTLPLVLAAGLLLWTGAPALVGEDAPPATLSPTWIPGRWDWNGSQYIWKAGRWDNTPETASAATGLPNPPPPPPPSAPPSAPPPATAQATGVPPPPQPTGPNQQWIPSHWDQGPSGWLYVVGHYESPPQSPPNAPAPAPTVLVQAQPQPQTMLIVQGAPPPDRIEVVGAPPTPDQVWLRGYWSIQAGAWLWVGGHWEVRHHHGAEWEPGRWVQTPRGYEWHDGHWH